MAVFASSIGEAARMAKMQRLHLAIVEVEIDGGEGLNFIRSIRADPFHGNRRMAIIACSETTSRARIHAARDAGANAFLLSPFSRAGLSAHVEYAMKDERPFIDAGGFCGPDRRRQRAAPYFGPERRASTQDLHFVA